MNIKAQINATIDEKTLKKTSAESSVSRLGPLAEKQFRFLRPKICENIRAGLADLFGII